MRRSAMRSKRRRSAGWTSFCQGLMLSGLIAAWPDSGSAQTTDIWTGSVGSWTDSTWSAGVPNNSGTTTFNVLINNGGPTGAVVTITGISPTISDLTLDAGNMLNIANNNSLAIAGGTATINGSLNVTSSGNVTDLILQGGASMVVGSGGSLNLSGGASARVYGSDTGESLTVNSGGTIQGQGLLGINSGGYAFNLANNGLIDANVSGQVLSVAPLGTVTNTGTMEATGGGILNLGGTIGNAGGTILASGAGSVVNLAGTSSSTITGGTLTTTGGGAMYSGGSNLGGVTISAGSTLTAQNNTVTVITGAVTNNGTIAVASTGNYTDLALQSGGSIVLQSGSSLTLSGSPYARVYGSDTGESVIVNSGATVQGQGQLGINSGGYAFNLTNSGIINANVSGAALLVAPLGTVTNTGTMEATGGGILNLGGTIGNAGGTILASGAGSVVNLAGAAASTIVGGTLTTTGGGTMYGDGSTLQNLTISAGSTVTLGNADTMILSGSITDKGTIGVVSTGNATDLYLTGAAVEVTSGGSITLSGSPYARIYATNSGETLTVDSGGTIQGQGQVGINEGGYAFTLTNHGTIDANVSGATLTVAPTSTGTNTGTMEATNGGTLVVGLPLTNTGGTIEAVGTGSVVSFSGADVTGGLVTASGGGTVSTTNSTLSGLTIDTGGVVASTSSTLDSVTINAGTTIQVQNNSVTGITGTTTSNGAIAVVSAGNDTDLYLNGGASLTLTSGASLTLSGTEYARVYGSNSGDTLTVDSGATVQGQGQLGINEGAYAFNLANAGTIDANVGGQYLSVATAAAVTNTGTMEATGGGTLDLAGTVNNAGGVILSDGAGSVVNLAGTAASTIVGGTLTTANGGAMYSGGSTLDGVTVSAGSIVTTQNNTLTGITGSVTDNGTIAVASTGNDTDLYLQGGASLVVSSGASLTLSGSQYAGVYGSASGDTLTVNAGGTIQGQGQLGINEGSYALNLVNAGTIDANVSGASLSVATAAAVTNTGTMEATNGGILYLGGTFNNAGGTIEAVGAGSSATLAAIGSTTINGGTLTTSGGGAMDNGTGGLTLNGVTVSGGSTLTLDNNTTTVLIGTITNNGTIALNSSGNYTILELSGAVTLGGTGTLSMSDQPYNLIYGITGSDSLTNGVGHTIEGAGQIGINEGDHGFSFTNEGTIIANGSATLQIAPSSTTMNAGTLQVDGGSTMEILGGLSTSGHVDIGPVNGSVASLLLMGDANNFIQTGGTTTLWTALSTLQLQSGQSVQLEGGTLQGIGTIMGDVVNSGGNLMPGLPGTIGTLTMTGSYSDPFGGQMTFQIDSTGSSLLDVGGTANLDGTTIDASLLNGFTPMLGAMYEIIATTNGVTGMGVTDPTFQDGGVTFQVVFSANDVYLGVIGVSSVPEPGSMLLLGLGVAGAAAARVWTRRRHARDA